MGWKETKASQAQTNCAYSALKILHDFASGKISAREADDQLWTECGMAVQTIVDTDGKELGIRILPDTTTIQWAKDFEFTK